MFCPYMFCVPPMASHGCEVWGHCKLQIANAASRQGLAKSHLQILRQISGVCKSTAVSILLAEFGLMCLPAQCLLWTVTFWNALAALPPGSYTKRWLWMPATGPLACRGNQGTGYYLCIRQDDMDQIDIQVLSSHLGQRRDAGWDNLDNCPRTCPTEDLCLCSCRVWFARPAGRHARSLLDLPLSMRSMQRLLRFRMGCHKLPGDNGCGLCVPRLNRFCNVPAGCLNR